MLGLVLGLELWIWIWIGVTLTTAHPAHINQADKMDGDIGGMILEPEQMQMLNALFVLVLIPIFDKCLYPLVALLVSCKQLKQLGRATGLRVRVAVWVAVSVAVLTNGTRVPGGTVC